MAQFHQHMQSIGRSRGRSAVAAAAYRAGCKLEEQTICRDTGVVTFFEHDYTKKGGIAHSEIMAPDGAPSWMKDREVLWNRIQNEFDTAKNSVFCKEMDLALPIELTESQNIELVRRYVSEVLVDGYGLVCDLNVHYDNPENPHAHIMTSTRSLVMGGDGEMTFGLKIRHLDDKKFLYEIRAQLAAYINRDLEKYGYPDRVSHLSYKARGIDMPATMHKGVGHHLCGAERAMINEEILEARADMLKDNPEIMLSAIQSERSYFTLPELEKRVYELLLDDNVDEGSIKSNDGEFVADDINVIKKSAASITKVLSTSKELVHLQALDGLGKQYFATQTRIDEEKEFLGYADKVYAKKLNKLSQREEAFINSKFGVRADNENSGFYLSPEQKNVIRHIVSGNGIVFGYAGSGKSTVLGVVKEIYDQRRTSVLGLAPTAKSRTVLTDAGIKAMTVHGLMRKEEGVAETLARIEAGLDVSDWKRRSALKYKSPFNGGVMILDEAGMVDLHSYKWLLRRCAETGTELKSIGDYNQLAVVKGIHGSFKALTEGFESASLTEIYRQSDKIDQKITKLFARYKVSEGLAMIKEHKAERLNFVDGGRDNLRQKIVSDYVSWFKETSAARCQANGKVIATKFDEVVYEAKGILGLNRQNVADVAKSGVVISYERGDVEKLNYDIRRSLFLSGALKASTGSSFDDHGNVLRIDGADKEKSDQIGVNATTADMGKGQLINQAGGRTLSLLIGEQIMFTKNDSRVGLYNGEVATVLKIGSQDKAGFGNILVRIHSEKESRVCWVDTSQYGHIDYGYALTVHKTQGSGYDYEWYDFSRYTGYEAFYVAITRFKQNIKMYFNKSELLDALYQQYDVTHDNNKIKLEGDLMFAGLERIISRRNGDMFVSGLEYSGDKNAGEYKMFNDNLERIFASQGDREEPLAAIKAAMRTESDKQSPLFVYGKYKEARQETSELYREINMDTQRANALGGDTKIFAHPKWNKFMAARFKRQVMAGHIIDNIEKFEVPLKVSRDNLSVIRDHADMQEFEVEKTFLEQSPKEENIAYQDVCSLQQKAMYRGDEESRHDLITRAEALYNQQLDIRDAIAAAKIESQEIKDSYFALVAERDKAASEIEQIEEAVLMAYVHDDKADKKNPLYEFDKRKGDKDIYDQIKANPAVLGDLKGKEYNFGLFKVGNYDRREIMAHAEHMSLGLKHRELRMHEVTELDTQIASFDLEARVAQAATEIKELERQDLGDGITEHLTAILNGENLWKLQEQAKQGLKANDVLATQSDPSETIADLKTAIKSKLTAPILHQFFEKHRRDIGLNDHVVIENATLKCGSFNIQLSEEKMGLWYRFSRKEGGDIFKLASYLNACESQDEIATIAALVGHEISGDLAKDIEAIQNIEIDSAPVVNAGYAKKDGWQPIEYPSRELDAVKDLPWLKGVDAIYDYRDKNGKLLGYTIRTVSKEDKKVIPVSYCKNEQGDEAWRAKGFTNNNIIYRAELLADKTKSVLIVEGEKTCDAANKYIRENKLDYVAISWKGGASNAANIDWSVLNGRNTVIWPDNDKAGWSAAKDIQKQIQCKIVPTAYLNLPEKWDLADPIPAGLDIKAAIEEPDKARMAVSDQIASDIGAISWKDNATEKQKCKSLYTEALAGLKERGLDGADYTQRLKSEISVIEQTGFADEFKVAANTIKYCKAHNIAIGEGRGSAVGSLAAYGLGIHNVDPVEYDLKFERFLVPGKKDAPDFDIDVSKSDRDKVVGYLMTTYDAALARTSDDRRHPSAIAIGYGDYEFDDHGRKIAIKCDAKVDILSSKVLDNINNTLDSINKERDYVVDLNEIDSAILSDKKTLDLIASGDTAGVFHMESNSAKDICRQIKPTSFEDVVNIMALNRPGAREYVGVISGRDQSDVIDPKGVFKDTNGAILYQEQIMEAAQVYFGIKHEESDAFRRELGKDIDTRIIADKENAIQYAINSGVSHKDAVNIYEQLEKFAAFGFNKSHAVAYSKTVMQTAFLKAHYPEEFAEHFLDGKQHEKERELLLDAPKINTELFDGAKAKIKEFYPDINNDVLEKAAGHLLEFSKKPFNKDLAGKLVDRAKFEIEYGPRIAGNLYISRVLDNPGEEALEKAHDQFKKEFDTDKLSKIYMDGKELSHILDKTKEIYHTRDEKIQFELEHNRYVKDFAKVSPDAAKYFAGQIVDYNMQYGGEVVPTMRRIEMMQNIAVQQSLLEKQLNKQLSESYDNVLTSEIAKKDKIAAIELATNRLCNSMSKEMQASSVAEIDIAKAQAMRNEEVKQIKVEMKQVQVEYTKEKQIEQEQQLQRDRDRGMER